MKIFNNRLFTAVICLVLAALITVFVIPSLITQRASTTTIVKLKQTIDYGTEITPDMLTTVSVGAFGLPDGVITDTSKVAGMCAASKLYATDYLTPDKLITKEQSTVASTYDVLVTVMLPSASAGVAGVLKPGDHVDVYDAPKSGGSATKIEGLAGIMVYDVLNGSMQSLDSTDKNGKTADKGSALSGDASTPQYVIFAASDSQAQTLVRLDRSGSIFLVYDKEVSK